MEVRNCPVTDAGIKGLCSNIQSIETLDIFRTGVTKNGIRMVLDSLPSLKVFCCNLPTELLAELSGTPLERFRSSVSKIFMNSIFNNKELLELLKMKSLSELHFSYLLGNFGVTFNGGILPLLKQFDSLTSLSIKCIFECPINIRAIVENCHKLESLSLNFIVTSSTGQSEDELMKTDPVLENLKTLELMYCDDLTSDDLDLLLASPALEKLTLQGIDSVNDVTFQKAENIHQFRNLEYLKLHCRNVTTKVIDMLMNDANPLKIIQICQLQNCRCNSWSRKDIRNWESTVREKSWNCVFPVMF